jgi:hypothetical protein
LNDTKINVELRLNKTCFRSNRLGIGCEQ